MRKTSRTLRPRPKPPARPEQEFAIEPVDFAETPFLYVKGAQLRGRFRLLSLLFE